MTTLGIFTVKTFRAHEGRWYTYGGFGEYLAEIRKHFDRVILVCHVRNGPPPKGHYEVPGDNLEIVRLPAWPTEAGALAASPIMLVKSLEAVRRMDVAHARMPDYTGVIGAFACRIAGVPCFHQIIDDWAVLARSIPAGKAFGLGLLLKAHLHLYDWLERQVSRGQLVFAQGRTAYDKHAPHSDAELVLSSAHHLGDVIAPAPRFGGPGRQVLCVGRLQSVKNHALMIEAIARLGPEWRLTIVGTGPLEGMLRQKAEGLGVGDRVAFAGHVRHGPELWRHYDEADLFVLPSLSEGTPKVVLEAMARGAPVVASAVSGVPTAVADGERGLLFPSGNLEALVAACERMASDPALRERCQAQAHDFAREQTVEASTERMLQKVRARWPQLGADPRA